MFSEIIWLLIIIVFTENKLPSIKMTLRIRFLLIYVGRIGRDQYLK